MASIGLWEWLDREEKERTAMVYNPNTDPLLKQVRELAHEIVATQVSPERQTDYLIAQQRSDRENALRTERKRQQELTRQQQAEARLEERRRIVALAIERKFYERNPHATRSDLERLWSKLWDETMLKAMDEPANANVAAYAENSRYNI